MDEENEFFVQEHPALHSLLPRQNRHTTKWVGVKDPSIIAENRQRAATIAPTLPPKKSVRNLGKTQSLDYRGNGASSLQRSRENPYLSLEDIETFPPNRPRSSLHSRAVENMEIPSRPPPAVKGIRPRQQAITGMLKSDQSVVYRQPVRSPTRFLANSQDVYTSASKKEDGGSSQFRPISPKCSIENSPNYSPNFDSIEAQPTSLTWQDSNTTGNTTTMPVSEKKENDFVDDVTQIQSQLFKLYKRIEEAPESSRTLAELKIHLRLQEHESLANVLEGIHNSLAPPNNGDIVNKKTMFAVDFRSFRDKQDLRHRIIEMFAKPGPPSVSYSKVDGKMNAIITEFCLRVENLRETQHVLIQSPAHARNILTGVGEAELLVKALRDNQLWIRWGTAFNLPPLYHLYQHKHPPSYEVRKAVTISFIAERLQAMPDINPNVDSHMLCPPIYSRLRTDSTKSKWQVTEYNAMLGKFETHECQFPSWLDDNSTAVSFLNSSNRTTFDLGTHHYALYSVFVIIIKDFTLAQQEDASRFNEKEQNWATPSKVQYYVGSSSTGVLYRFAHVKNSHCERMKNVLSDVFKLQHFRCYEGCDLVEACLALAWARRQPRAVFVLNSFLKSNMSSLSLEQKAPFKEKMLALAGHLTEGKKLGSLYDMRYGMNGTTTIRSDEE